MGIEECPRCMQFESNHKFKNCSFSVSKLECGSVVQKFDCTRCNFKWENKYNEGSIDNGSALWGETGQSELF